MTMADFAFQLEGLDPVRVHRALGTLVDLLGVGRVEAPKVEQFLADAQHLIDVVKTNMPRVEQFIADAQSQIAAFEAKQKQLRGGR